LRRLASLEIGDGPVTMNKDLRLLGVKRTEVDRRGGEIDIVADENPFIRKDALLRCSWALVGRPRRV
jgi:hypothetical protein